MTDRKDIPWTIEAKASYWFDCADVTISRPLWPRHCDITDQWLWLKPAVKGKTEYWTRGGSHRTDVRWADERALIEFKLRWA